MRSEAKCSDVFLGKNMCTPNKDVSGCFVKFIDKHRLNDFIRTRVRFYVFMAYKYNITYAHSQIYRSFSSISIELWSKNKLICLLLRMSSVN